MKTKLMIALLIASLLTSTFSLISIVGCSDKEDVTAYKQVEETTTATVEGKGLYQTWHVWVDGEGDTYGKSTMTFYENGTYEEANSDGVFAKGTFDYDGEYLTVTVEGEGTYSCRVIVKGSYMLWIERETSETMHFIADDELKDRQEIGIF